MILAWSAPGVFGGDSLEQSIRVRRGASVRLTSQSSMQVHPSADGALARLHARYDVEDGASLSCEWHPVIPFAASRFSQRIDLRLAAGARLAWSDAMMAGRQGRGERWAFEEFGHELALSRGGSLDYLERVRIVPAGQSPAQPWVAADAAYFGTTLVSAGEMDAAVAEGLHQRLAERPGIRAAADVIEPGLLLVRLMANDGPAFHEARELLARSNASAVSCA